MLPMRKSTVFTHDQTHNHAIRMGFSCASIIMREELTRVRPAERSIVLANDQLVMNTRTGQYAHRAMSILLNLDEMPSSRWDI